MFNWRRMKKYLPHIGFLILVFLFFYRFLDGAEIFAFKDLSRYFYPLRLLMHDQVLSFAWPLWNPFIFYGMPLMGSLQIGLFYPLTLIYYIMPFDFAFNYYIVIHYFLAAIFMFWFMRSLKASKYASFFSSVAFAFSGYLLSVSNMNTSLTSVIWLPLVIMFYDKFLRFGFRNSNFGFLIMALALMFLGGEPTIIYCTFFILTAWALVFNIGKKEKIRGIAFLISAFILMALLVSVQLIPFIELAMKSNRSTLGTFDMVTLRSLPIRESVNMIFPFFFGNLLRPTSYTPVLLGNNIQDWLLSPYMGVIPFLFLIFSFFKREKKIIWFFFVLSLISLILAFGKYTPIYHVLYSYLPGISFIRYPIKYLFMTTFAVSALAGFGFDELRHNPQIRKFAVIVMSVAASMLFAFYIISNVYSRQFFLFLKGKYIKDLHPMYVKALSDNIQFNIQTLLYASLMVGAVLLLFLLWRKNIIRGHVFSIAVIGLFCIDLLSANIGINIPSDPSVYHKITPNIKILMGQAGIERLYYTPTLEAFNRNLYGEKFDEALIEAKDRFAGARLMPHNLYDAFGYESIELQDHTDLYLNCIRYNDFKDIRILNMVNARFFADTKPIRISGLKLLKKSDYYYGQVYLYKNPFALPRAYIVGGYRLAQNRKIALAMMHGKKFNPAKEIILDEKPEVAGGQKYKEAKILSYKPNEVIISAELKKPGFLFLSDTYYPGWRVFVDAREHKILRANYMFRAVALDRGPHIVRFVYDPLSFKIGGIVSCAAIFILVRYFLVNKKDESKL